ncbi:MAG: hypothetical protein HYV09_20465 [Deltaproteobacteria bacterium]|nr:hypothetical protein [Deltaproteobacteria bacterium]
MHALGEPKIRFCWLIVFITTAILVPLTTLFVQPVPSPPVGSAEPAELPPVPATKWYRE